MLTRKNDIKSAQKVALKKPEGECRSVGCLVNYIYQTERKWKYYTTSNSDAVLFYLKK